MRKTTLFALLLLAFASSFISSCKVEGCTDPESNWYNPDATHDDGTCNYISTVQFWWDEAAYVNFVGHSYVRFYYFFNDVEMGTTQIYLPIETSPNCNDIEDPRLFTFNIGTEKTSTIEYRARINSPTGKSIVHGTLTLNAGHCTTKKVSIW